MRRRDVLGGLMALAATGAVRALAQQAPAASQPPAAAAAPKFPKPRFLAKLRIRPGNTPQGLWIFNDGQMLLSQDVDGFKKRGWMRFTLLSKSGSILQEWELQYGSHGQSLHARPAAGGGFEVFTESANRDGIAVFALNAKRDQMKFVREVLPKGPKGRPFKVFAFGVDDKRDLAACGFDRPDSAVIQRLSFSGLLDGVMVPIAPPIIVPKPVAKKYGPMQGIGSSANGSTFALFGDSKKKHIKRLIRVGPAGKQTIIPVNAARGRAMFDYEPEGLFVQGNRVAFCLYDYFWSRVYTLPVT